MKQWTAALTLMVLMGSPCDAAEWKFISSMQTGDLFIDSTSIKQHGNISAFKVLLRFHHKYSAVGSLVYDHEIICRQKSFRVLLTVSHTGFEGDGDIVGSIESGRLSKDALNFSPITTGSDQETMYRFVCLVSGR